MVKSSLYTGLQGLFRTDRVSNHYLGRGWEGKQGRLLSMKGKLGVYAVHTLISSMLWSFSVVRNAVVLLCRTISNACYSMDRQLLNMSLLNTILSRIICVTPGRSPVITQDLFSCGTAVLSIIYLQRSPSDARNEQRLLQKVTLKTTYYNQIQIAAGDFDNLLYHSFQRSQF